MPLTNEQQMMIDALQGGPSAPRANPFPDWFVDALRGALDGSNPQRTDQAPWWGDNIEPQRRAYEKLAPELVLPDLGPQRQSGVLTPNQITDKTFHPSESMPPSYGGGRYRIGTLNQGNQMDRAIRALGELPSAYGQP